MSALLPSCIETRFKMEQRINRKYYASCDTCFYRFAVKCEAKVEPGWIKNRSPVAPKINQISIDFLIYSLEVLESFCPTWHPNGRSWGGPGGLQKPVVSMTCWPRSQDGPKTPKMGPRPSPKGPRTNFEAILVGCWLIFRRSFIDF